MAQVTFPRALVAIIPGLPMRAEIEAQDVRTLIAALDDRWPGVLIRLCATAEHLREHIQIFVDGQQATLEMPVRERSVVRIMTAVSGG